MTTHLHSYCFSVFLNLHITVILHKRGGRRFFYNLSNYISSSHARIHFDSHVLRCVKRIVRYIEHFSKVSHYLILMKTECLNICCLQELKCKKNFSHQPLPFLYLGITCKSYIVYFVVCVNKVDFKTFFYIGSKLVKVPSIR